MTSPESAPSPEIEVFREALLEWADGNLRDLPWRNTASPYEVLIAEILLQRTLAV